MTTEAYVYGKRGLFVWQKRPIAISIPEVCVSVKRGLPYGKRGLFMWQKRPTDILTYLRYAYAYAQVSKEAYHMAKEAYLCGKRDLQIY